MKRETIFSPCRKYRYTLWREWDIDSLTGTSDDLPNASRYVQFIGLNPSTADETQDDPTIRRCIGFAKSWGFGALCMTNIFAWRDTLPANMKKAEWPVGEESNFHILESGHNAGLVVAAWGKDGSHHNRGQHVANMISFSGIKLHHLGFNSNGTPKHPLYLKKDLQPIEWKL